MKLLLDEDLDPRIRHEFANHDARTVKYMGWLGEKNGELLKLARDQFDVFVTCDQSIPYQQNLTQDDVAILIFRAKTNSLKRLQPLIPQALKNLKNIRRGEIVFIDETESQ